MSFSFASIWQDLENVFTTVSPVIAAAAPQGSAIVAGVQTAETVGNAVIDNLPGHTAAADVAAGLSALAGSPAVQSNPGLAGKLTGVALIFADILKDIGVEK